MKASFVRIFATVGALGSFACSPTIYRFSATPSSVCKGQTSTLSWAASHRGSITASPPNESPGTVFAEGTSIVTPQASGTYHLESAHLVGSTGQDVRVEVTGECAPAPAPAAEPAPAAAAPAAAPPTVAPPTYPSPK